MIYKAEAQGFGIALAGHAALLAMLSLGFAATRPPLLSQPIEVSFVDEVALESAAPSAVAPAPRLADVAGPVEPAPAPPVEPVPAPPQPRIAAPAPVPAPTPAPAPRATKPSKPAAAPTRPAPPKAAPARPAPRSTGRLKGLLTGVGERDSPSQSVAPNASTISAAARSSLGAEVRRQLKPHWKAPTGADSEQLRTELSIALAADGAVTEIEILRTTGQTDSNRPQVKLHQEQAVRAVRIASPFKLPPEYYEAWKLLSPIGFDRRLSQ